MEQRRNRIRVLIVDDSRVARELLSHIFAADPELEIAGVVNDGEEALEAVRRLRPDLVTMDVHMPRLDGYEATRAIMETLPTPVVIVSANTDVKDVAFTFRAMEAGALAVLARPPGPGDPNYQEEVRALIQTVKLMSEIKLVKRTPRLKPGSPAPSQPCWPKPFVPAGIQLVAIGASMGGPQSLQTILSGLPTGFDAPVLIVQHIAPRFAPGFVEWLSGSSHFPVNIATDGEALLPGRGYLAPDGFHLGVDGASRIALDAGPPDNGLRPSVHHLFLSAAEVFGRRAIGVLLTGMGRDGAAGLAAMRQEGAITIAQDEASSIVFGMPGEAVRLGAAQYVLPPEGIIDLVTALVGTRPGLSERVSR